MGADERPFSRRNGRTIATGAGFSPYSITTPFPTGTLSTPFSTDLFPTANPFSTRLFSTAGPLFDTPEEEGVPLA